MRIGIISGYFNPIHSGHIDYIESAAAIVDELIIIVNNDKQVTLKKSIPFQDENERLKIVSSLRDTTFAFISIDEDCSVCESLKLVRKMRSNIYHDELLFMNGGDRKADNIPEYKLCEELGIEMIFNVGGKKTQSSSKLLAPLQRLMNIEQEAYEVAKIVG